MTDTWGKAVLRCFEDRGRDFVHVHSLVLVCRRNTHCTHTILIALLLFLIFVFLILLVRLLRFVLALCVMIVCAVGVDKEVAVVVVLRLAVLTARSLSPLSFILPLISILSLVWRAVVLKALWPAWDNAEIKWLVPDIHYVYGLLVWRMSSQGGKTSILHCYYSVIKYAYFLFVTVWWHVLLLERLYGREFQDNSFFLPNPLFLQVMDMVSVEDEADLSFYLIPLLNWVHYHKITWRGTQPDTPTLENDW